jgi:hypothetical protein
MSGFLRFDGTAWHPMTSQGAVLAGNINVLSIVGRTMYIGGNFNDFNGQLKADKIVAYSLDAPHHYDSMTTDGGITSGVNTIVSDHAGGLYVGGSFGDLEGISPADFIARWRLNNDGIHHTWGTVDDVVSPALGDIVRSMAWAGGKLYIAGDFVNARGIDAADRIVRWDGTNWSAAGSSSAFGEGPYTKIFDVVADGSRVFAVGTFHDAAGNAKVDGVAGFVGGRWRPVGTNADGTDGPVDPAAFLGTAAVVGGRLYVGGVEPYIGGGPINSYGAWYRLHQPDALIALGTSSPDFIGNNRYNATGSGQSVARTIHRGKTRTFFLKFTNDGYAADRFSVKGPDSIGAFVAHYLAGATDVTAAVVNGTYTIPSLAPGASKILTLKIGVENGVPVGTVHSWLVKERWRPAIHGAPFVLDTVEAKVTAG